MAVQQPETPRIQIVIRHLFGWLLAAALLTGCGKEEPAAPQEPGTTPHTLLLYMPGTDLLSYYRKNIEGIERAVSASVPGEGRIVVCYQPESHRSATLIELRCDEATGACVRRELKTYDRFDASSQTDVGSLFADVQELAPAKSYGLVIGCHGKGWLPAGASLRESGYAAFGAQGEQPEVLVTRAFGDSGHELTIAGLAGALAGLRTPFDYLIFDACFMANIETLYDLRSTCRYLVASPCEIMGAGFPYDRVIPHLFLDRGARYDLQQVCRAFCEFYMYDWDTIPRNAQSGCISLAVTAEIEALAQCTADIIATAAPLTDAAKQQLQSYEGLSSHLFYDLGDYLQAVCSDLERYVAFERQLERTFPQAARLHTPTFYSAFNNGSTPVEHYSGVSTSEPVTRYTEPLSQTAWHRRVHAGN